MLNFGRGGSSKYVAPQAGEVHSEGNPDSEVNFLQALASGISPCGNYINEDMDEPARLQQTPQSKTEPRSLQTHIERAL